MNGIARRVGELLGRQPSDEARPMSGGDVCDAYRVELADGLVFAKTRDDAPADFFAAEAAGLELLRSTGAVAVPDVLAVADDVLVLEWLDTAAPNAAEAERLGHDLAVLHGTPAPHYGTTGPLYVGPVPLTTPDPPTADPAGWPRFHAEHRLLPLLRTAVDGGGIDPRDARDVELLCERIDEVAGPPQPPAVIHGDLWAGNILWTGERPRLVDPAGQGGHPEADLAFLELFGCPEWERVIGAYEEVRPVPGRRDRAALHVLHHVLLHAALFGGPYGAQSGATARRALRVAR